MPLSFYRATKQRPCPKCHGHAYCSIAHDGTIVFCASEPEGAIKSCSNGRYLHRIHGKSVPSYNERRYRDALPTCTDWSTYQPVDRDSLEGLAARLGVRTQALAALEVGYQKRLWTAPMFNGRRERIGIHLRRSRVDGDAKFCVKGSQLGLFLPVEALSSDELFVAEGLSDTAALLSMGLCGVGRPSNGHGLRLLCDLVRGRRASVVIVGDNDHPGREGVRAMLGLRLFTPLLRVIYPPPDFKDVREWLRGGGDAPAVRDLVATAEHIPLRVEVEK